MLLTLRENAAGIGVSILRKKSIETVSICIEKSIFLTTLICICMPDKGEI